MTERPRPPARSILFVCLGNICRSPLAEGVLLHLLAEEGLADEVRVDSAGTGAWHVGEPPDPRSVEVARKHGVDLPGRGRQVRPEDFHAFDLILAMDRSNLRNLRTLLESVEGDLPPARLRLFREFDPEARDRMDVPDPYYGGPGGFDDVYEMILRGCRELLDEVRDPRR